MNEWFKRAEFQCQCGCGLQGVDAELLTVLTRIREHFDAPVTITSGNRCERHNKAVGGVEGSMHTKGIAADFKVSDTAPFEVAGQLEEWYPDSYGIGVYPSWVHLDVRKERSRW